MQPVQHLIDYYETKLVAQWIKEAPNIPTSTKLKETIHHYEILNGTWTWTPRANFTPAEQHEIPFDPPYRSMRQEDAYNKLLEAGELDPNDT